MGLTLSARSPAGPPATDCPVPPVSTGGRLRPRAQVFVALVVLLAAAITVLLAGRQLPRIPWISSEMLPCYLLAALAVLGELRPIPVLRDDGESDAVTVTSTFGTALVVVGPLTLAVLALCLSDAYDEARSRRSPYKAAFNIAQYVLVLAATRGVYCVLAGRSFLDVTGTVTRADIVPIVVAAVAYIVTNHLLVNVAVALDSGLSLPVLLREDLERQGVFAALLVAMAPFAAVAARFSLPLLVLLVLPIVGTRHAANLAERRVYEAQHDALTGLPGRQLLLRRADSALGAGGPELSLLLVHLEELEQVNDTLGYAAGDALLVEVARRLSAEAPDGWTVSRISGNEFAVLLPADGTDRAPRLAAALRAPVVMQGVRVPVQCRIGVATGTPGSTSAEQLARRADVALHGATGMLSGIAAYSADSELFSVDRLELLGDLRVAVELDQLRLVYQPQLAVETGEVVAFEALARWEHPTRGLVMPDTFIPVAERSGTIAPITRWALDTALTTVAGWREQLLPGLSVAVNVSARMLTDLDLPGYLAAALRCHGVPADALTIEVTESSIMADPTRALEILGAMHELGVRLSIDDFGTGYSSLAYLSRLDAHEIKIDKSFVLRLGSDHHSAVIVRSTVELGHALGLTVVAEGVEDTDAVRRLRDLGCDRIQGYHIARPLAVAAVPGWVRARP